MARRNPTYTIDSEFDNGFLVNIVVDHRQKGRVMFASIDKSPAEKYIKNHYGELELLQILVDMPTVPTTPGQITKLAWGGTRFDPSKYMANSRRRKRNPGKYSSLEISEMVFKATHTGLRPKPMAQTRAALKVVYNKLIRSYMAEGLSHEASMKQAEKIIISRM